jgi:hypothetical protein
LLALALGLALFGLSAGTLSAVDTPAKTKKMDFYQVWVTKDGKTTFYSETTKKAKADQAAQAINKLPGGKITAEVRTVQKDVKDATNLSGSAWWRANQAKYPNSTSLADLDADFRAKVNDFLAALKDAGASVTISTTKRNKDRAYLMHYSWAIAKGEISPRNVPAQPGVDIDWDHGDDTASREAAQEMVSLFGMAHQAALTSRHIEGKAIDMNITWSDTLKIKKKDGTVVEIGAPRTGSGNTTLHGVGKTYGVIKLVTDAPHWSTDGS